MIELINVNKEYKNCKALSCINLKLQEGLFYAITGESGSGKSTLLSIIGGLIFPTTGKVLFNSEDISNFNDKKMTFLRQNIISFVFFKLLGEYLFIEIHINILYLLNIQIILTILLYIYSIIIGFVICKNAEPDFKNYEK